MGEYIQRTLGIELLRLYAEFAKDENGFIWLFFAKDCHFRWQEALKGGLKAQLMSATEAAKIAAAEKKLKE